MTEIPVMHNCTRERNIRRARNGQGAQRKIKEMETDNRKKNGMSKANANERERKGQRNGELDRNNRRSKRKKYLTKIIQSSARAHDRKKIPEE